MESVDDDRVRRNLALLERCFAAIGRGDVEALVANYSDDYVLELPYSTPSRHEGREQVAAFLSRVFGVLRFELTLLERHATQDPDLIIAEYESRGQALETGRPFANRYVGFWWFAGDRVRRTREYTDPRALAAAGIATLAARPEDA